MAEKAEFPSTSNTGPSASESYSSPDDLAQRKADFENNDPRFDYLSEEEKAEYKNSSTSEDRLTALEDKAADAYFAAHPGESTIVGKNGDTILTVTTDEQPATPNTPSETTPAVSTNETTPGPVENHH